MMDILNSLRHELDYLSTVIILYTESTKNKEYSITKTFQTTVWLFFAENLKFNN